MCFVIEQYIKSKRQQTFINLKLIYTLKTPEFLRTNFFCYVFKIMRNTTKNPTKYREHLILKLLKYFKHEQSYIIAEFLIKPKAGF